LKISVIVTLKKDVLDPQGTTIKKALEGMNFKNINSVRQGKYFEIEIDEKNKKKAEDKIEEMCKKLLANLVIEDYKIIESK
jgi:phosphoribosylformylglycinamidine synthase|tara:strand:- start:807 stop:1049 length:243 start_codon:yes stop_codon:yes gene_type:complete